MKPKKVFSDNVHTITIDHDAKRNNDYPFNINIIHHEDGIQSVLIMDEKEVQSTMENILKFVLNIYPKSS